MINFNNIFVFVVFIILILGLVYSSSFFIYFMYVLFLGIFINSIYLIYKKEIKFGDLTLQNFNAAHQSGIMGVLHLVLSLLAIIFFYSNYGFPCF